MLAVNLSRERAPLDWGRQGTEGAGGAGGEGLRARARMGLRATAVERLCRGLCKNAAVGAARPREGGWLASRMEGVAAVECTKTDGGAAAAVAPKAW